MIKRLKKQLYSFFGTLRADAFYGGDCLIVRVYDERGRVINATRHEKPHNGQMRAPPACACICSPNGVNAPQAAQGGAEKEGKA